MKDRITKMEDIKTYLTEHPNMFSEKKNCQINEIIATKKYYFNCDKYSHQFYANPREIINTDGSINCVVCSNRQVFVGYNDIATTAPQIAKYLKNKEDAFRYVKNSEHMLDWQCPDCLNEWEATPKRMSERKNLCLNCGGVGSYPEKFVLCFLDQLGEFYKYDCIFDWSDRKRYDFWLYQRNIIIGTHGKQHYQEAFCIEGNRSLEEEQDNDAYKKEIALQHGIEEYIILDCRKSEKDYIKDSIMSSLLPTLLDFDKDDIDWDYCHIFALSNLIKTICESYSQGKTIKDLVDIYKKSKTTIRTYLKQGTELGWCNYNPYKIREEIQTNNYHLMIQKTSKPVLQIDKTTDKVIKRFGSISSAERELHISGIGNVVTGRRKAAGGYKWVYA